MQCEECRFYERKGRIFTTRKLLGHCQRYPPTVEGDKTGLYSRVHVFKIVHSNGLCGEFQEIKPGAQE